MCAQILAHLSLVLLLVLILYSADLTASKCPSRCGNVSIPYPFGIGEGCYLSEWFEIRCNNNSIPYLPKINKRVVKVDLPDYELLDPDPIGYRNSPFAYGSLRIQTTISSIGCSKLSDINGGFFLNLTDSPFNISSFNKLVAVGCNNMATLTNLQPRLAGCISSCRLIEKPGSSSCDGYRCCQADTPEEMGKIVGVSIENSHNNITEGRGGCRVAFLTDEFDRFPVAKLNDPQWFYDMQYVTVQLRWVIPMMNDLSFIKSLRCGDKNCVCVGTYRYDSNDIEEATCFCNPGYTGNPYKFDGCKDIDECRLRGRQRVCQTGTCVNKEGGYDCVVKKNKALPIAIDGKIVAVKKSKLVDEDKLDEFINEVVILSQINHRNIVKLLGCCLETEVPLLVYEFIPNGNLFEHLHDESDDYTMATWEVRLRIAIDIAGALSYLHSAASSPIYHRDIKTTNIMLDEKYRAKVSDFGTSRSVTVDHTHLTTVVSGTVGYVDPEYFQSSQFTDKSDVYSFGVVLVELITGEKPISFLRFQENRTLATYFLLAMKDNKLLDIIDPRIRDDCKLEEVTVAAKLAWRCLNLSGKKRPSMREVLMELERIRSPCGESQPHVQFTEKHDVEEVAVELTFGVESGVTAPMSFQDNAASTSWLGAEPLFPRQTW
ncbi:unnamed protein product [Cochlearia groenlandica]